MLRQQDTYYERDAEWSSCPHCKEPLDMTYSHDRDCSMAKLMAALVPGWWEQELEKCRRDADLVQLDLAHPERLPMSGLPEAWRGREYRRGR